MSPNGGLVMSDLVPASDIERIVGVQRHPTLHYGRVVSADQRIYVLHSHECKNSGIDLRDCRYSLALDRRFGFDLKAWADSEYKPVILGIRDGLLVPAGVMPATYWYYS